MFGFRTSTVLYCVLLPGETDEPAPVIEKTEKSKQEPSPTPKEPAKTPVKDTKTTVKAPARETAKVKEPSKAASKVTPPAKKKANAKKGKQVTF